MSLGYLGDSCLCLSLHVTSRFSVNLCVFHCTLRVCYYACSSKDVKDVSYVIVCLHPSLLSHDRLLTLYLPELQNTKMYIV
jgi:hypothetical protein